MFSPNSPIGIIDSGIGGFSVAKTAQQMLPHENFIYMGDGANAPYGNFSQEDILTLTRYMVKFMRDQGVKALLVGCNTVSCLLPHYQDEIDCPVLSVVQAGADAICQQPDLQVAVFSTCFTQQTGCYPQLVATMDPQKTLYSKGCANLAGIIERGMADPQSAPLIDQELLREFGPIIEEQNISCCVLACTHYPLVAPRIQALFPQAKLLDPAQQMAQTVAQYLDSHQLRNTSDQPGRLDIFTTGSVEEYTKSAQRVGLSPVTSVQYHPPMPPST